MEDQLSHSENIKSKILNNIEDENIVDEMVQIKTENFFKYIETPYIIVCLLVIFFSLLHWQYCSPIFSLLITLSLGLLHFKDFFLKLIYKKIIINDKKINKKI